MVQPANKSLWNWQRSRYLEEEKTIFGQIWSTLRNQAQIQPNVSGFSPSSQVYPGERIPLILEDLKGFEVAGLLPYSLVNQIITGFFSEPDCTGLLPDSVHFLAPTWTCLEEPKKSFGTQ